MSDSHEDLKRSLLLNFNEAGMQNWISNPPAAATLLVETVRQLKATDVTEIQEILSEADFLAKLHIDAFYALHAILGEDVFSQEVIKAIATTSHSIPEQHLLALQSTGEAMKVVLANNPTLLGQYTVLLFSFSS